MPVPAKNSPITRPSMREEVYNTLLAWIMEGELRPGEKLLDKELAENMGVSRTPVREALRRLEDKSLVESSANRWTRVSEVSVKEPEMIYPIIWNLEELAVAQAMEYLTQADLKKMKDANTALGKALEEANPVKAYTADERFHDVYIQRSQNPHLVNILQDLKIKSRRVEVTYFKEYACAKYSLEEHCRIMNALMAKDLDLVRSLIRSNWQSSLKRLKDIECRVNFDETTN
ncbi:MAG: GntR family transcriptional regulator [Desulfobacula sp.]|uniref:GntR family transcriptional regulator n=1 Tax=Desulfobacula sp. TaxID=2593537 RepID=UPI0025C0A163|nr:GntR family transcriptional regulator [Desulfobacula sp.]MCD4722917.1 GntR family transcriptional regulator [Desulfobacula sp.]